MISLTRSFLTNRSMRVRTGKLLSDPRNLNGGSPQGSILGCFLYCIATQQLNLDLVDTSAANDARERPGEPNIAPVEDRANLTPPAANQGGFNLMPQELDEASNSSGDSFLTADDNHDQEDDPDWDIDSKALIVLFKYVDDTTSVETVQPGMCTRHITASKPTEKIPAIVTNTLLEAIVTRAGDMGMKVNCHKTQMLCLSPDNGYDSWASVAVDGETIQSQGTMKLLGFVLGTAPGVGDHVEHVKDKFRARFWTLIHLRRAGVRGDRLFRLYAALIRPVLEVNSVVFHSMLTKTQAEAIERLQKQVCRLCYGWAQSYRTILQANNLQTLAERREKAIRRFVSKTLHANPRFSNRWFTRRPEVETSIRNRRPYVKKKARTDRYKKSPLLYMQKIANDLSTM